MLSNQVWCKFQLQRPYTILKKKKKIRATTFVPLFHAEQVFDVRSPLFLHIQLVLGNFYIRTPLITINFDTQQVVGALITRMRW